MKKICYVTAVSLSIKSFFIPQIKYLSEKGYEMTVICSEDEELYGLLGKSVKFIPIKIERGISIKNVIYAIYRLYAVFRKEKFDLVQYSTPNAAFCASIAAKLAGIGVRNYHIMGLRYLGEKGTKRKLLKALDKLSCSMSTNIECITQSNLRLCTEEKLFNPQKAKIIWHGSSGGVDIHRFNRDMYAKYRKETREKCGISEDDFVFGFVGRITKDKGINELLRAFYDIDKNCKLLLIGNKDGIDTLDKSLWDRVSEDKRIIGIFEFVPNTEKYYPAMDVLLLPSYREGFGMVIAEAAAMGVPSVISNIPGPVDVVSENKTAYVVPVKDAEKLRDKMLYCMENPEQITEMSEECVKFVNERFDSEKLNEKIYEQKKMLIGE